MSILYNEDTRSSRVLGSSDAFTKTPPSATIETVLRALTWIMIWVLVPELSMLKSLMSLAAPEPSPRRSA